MRLAIYGAVLATLALALTAPAAASPPTAVGEPFYNAPPSPSGKSFMQVDGVVGDVRDTRHSGWLQIDNLAVQCFTPRRPGKACSDAVIVSRHIDAFSHQLGKACLDKTHFPKVVVETFLGGGPDEGWSQFTYTLTDAWISDCSINWSGYTEELFVLRAADVKYGQGWYEGPPIVPLPRGDRR